MAEGGISRIMLCSQQVDPAQARKCAHVVGFATKPRPEVLLSGSQIVRIQRSLATPSVVICRTPKPEERKQKQPHESSRP